MLGRKLILLNPYTLIEILYSQSSFYKQ